MHERGRDPLNLPERQRCPRCGGPILTVEDAPPESESAGSCLNCGYEIRRQVRRPANRGGPQVPVGLLVVLVVLAGGVVAGIAVAALSNLPTLGGWLLVLLGIGLVVVMGAFEAGYLERPKAKVRTPLQHQPPD